MSKRNQEKRRSANSVIIAVVIVLLLIVAAGIFFISKIQQAGIVPPSVPTAAPTVPPTATPEPTLSPAELEAIERQRLEREEAMKKAEEERRLNEAKYSFYQKLANGMDVNILILGDSEAMENNGDPISGTVNGTRFSGLAGMLREKYYKSGSGKVTVTNYATAYGNLLADALRVGCMSDTDRYDLVIMCYGLNDENKDVLSNFEALILALRKKLPDASMICTLEPCFHSITSQLETMRNVSEIYSIPVIDLFGTFYEKGRDGYFSCFGNDQTHLSDVGQAEWDRLLMEVIDENAASGTGKMTDVPPVTVNAAKLAAMEFIPADDARVQRLSDTDYAFNINAKGFTYIQHPEKLEKGDARIVADDILYALGKPSGIKSNTGSCITYVFEDLVCTEAFTLSFSSKALADGFEGIYIQLA